MIRANLLYIPLALDTDKAVSDVSTSTYRHVIHGPSPLDASQIDFLPRLKAALDIVWGYPIKQGLLERGQEGMMAFCSKVAEIQDLASNILQ